jgi:hypothetical protein
MNSARTGYTYECIPHAHAHGCVHLCINLHTQMHLQAYIHTFVCSGPLCSQSVLQCLGSGAVSRFILCSSDICARAGVTGTVSLCVCACFVECNRDHQSEFLCFNRRMKPHES